MSANAYKLLNISRDVRPHELLLMYRVMSLVGSVCFPFFYYAYELGTAAGYPTGIGLPLAMSGFCLLYWIGTYRFAVVRDHVQDSAVVLFYLFTAHSIYNLAASGFHISFLLALMMIFIIFSIAIDSKMQLTGYVLFAFMSFALVNFSMNPFGDAFMYQTNVATQLLILHIVIAHKIELKKTLANKAELMSKLFSNSPDAIVFIDMLSNHIVNCNEAALQLFGFMDKEKLREAPLRRFFPGGLISKTLQNAVPTVARGDAFSSEEQLVTRRGRVFWANVALSNFAIGRRQFLVVRVTDSDHIHKTTEALRRSEARNRDLIESSPSLIGLHNLDGTITMVNPAFEAVLGLRADEITGTTLLRYIPRRNESAYRRYTEELVHNGSSQGVMPILDARNRMRYLKYHNTLKTDDNGELVVRAMAIDITENYLLQQDMARSEKRFRLISENAHDLICQHAVDGKFSYISVSVSRMLGFQPDDLVGGDPMDLVHPDDRKLFKLLSPFYSEPVDHEPSVVEYRMLHKTGRAVWVHTIFKPVLND
ncbi:MAG TPA: PAS domain-containing protein, partial [Chitinophagales bacterium]|nr:PAS domain-containing protein [Chitinophagales bacterium]